MSEEDSRRPIAQAIRQRREALGLSQDDAAQRAGLSVSTWRNAESGRTKLAQPTRERIEDALEWEQGTLRSLAAGEWAVIDPDIVSRVDELERRVESVERALLAIAEVGKKVGSIDRMIHRSTDPGKERSRK